MATLVSINRTRLIQWFETLTITNKLRPSRKGGFYMFVTLRYNISSYCDLEYTEYKGIYSMQDATKKFDERFLFHPSDDHKVGENEAVFVYEINLPVYVENPEFSYI